MSTNNIFTPKKVVEQDLYFSIPLYQRLFEWGVVQVEQLLMDLFESFKNRPNSYYYIGMLTRVHHMGTMRWDLVDGQQRFVVMTLLGVMLKDYDKGWMEFLRNGDRIEFVAREEDHEYIKSCISGGKVDVINTNMKNAIDCMGKFVEARFGEEERPLFAEFVYNHLAFFFSELPKNYAENPTSLNKYFEVMNSSGKNLEQYEILKVQLLQGVKDQDYLLKIWNVVSQMNKLIIVDDNDDNSVLNKKYEQAIDLCKNNQYQDVLERCISSQEEVSEEDTIAEIKSKKVVDFRVNSVDVGENGLISFSEFLLMMLDIEMNLGGSDQYYNVNKLLERFHTNPIEKRKEFYEKMLFYRLLLDCYVVRKEYRDSTGYYKLLYNDGHDDRSRVRQYQSMLNVSYSSQFYHWIKPFLQEVAMLNQDEISSEVLYTKLRDIDNRRHGVVPQLNEMSYGRINRYWFWRLDYHLWEYRECMGLNSAQQSVISKYVFRENRSIEHLHPQDETNNDKWARTSVDAFGNLAMISQSFNSLQSNESVHFKFARIEDQIKNGSLQSIKMYMMYLAARHNYEEWSEELSQKHGELMHRFLVECCKGNEVNPNLWEAINEGGGMEKN